MKERKSRMRIMLDTNVLISLLLFPNQRMNRMMEYIFTDHELVLSSFIVDELKYVVRCKFPSKTAIVDKFLLKLSYDFVYTPEEIDEGLFHIRDVKDYPVLYTAIIEDVDVLITGDKDFVGVEVDELEILTPTEFIERYVQGTTT